MQKEKLSGIYDAKVTYDEVAGTTRLYYDFNWFAEDSAVYNHQLARFLAQMIVVGYDNQVPDEDNKTGYPLWKPNLNKCLEDLGFRDIWMNAVAKRDEVVYFIANRDIALEDKTINLVFAGFIGSYMKQWFSNFDPLGVERVCNDGKGYASDEERGIVHLGFADARDYVHGKLEKYVDTYPSEYERKLVIIGHSRGAATANLLGAKLIKNGGLPNLPLPPQNLFTYCYATPNGVNVDKVEMLEDYKRIFNFVSPEDFVTVCLPEACGFGKYGTVFKLLGDDNKSVRHYNEQKDFMQPYYFEIFGMNTYHPFRRGNKAVKKVIGALAKELRTVEDFYEKPLKECFKTVTPYEYFRDTLCAYVAGGETEEEKAAADRAMKLLIESSVDYVGTSAAYRITSAFFVFKEGIGAVTGNRLMKTHFSESHMPATYASYLLAMSEEQLMANTAAAEADDEPEEEDGED
ncbi:MAG: hypothetical protein IJ168_00055 [Eubacterium sp.]|nr:hypothetical protein [Eubacterium sp.]